MKDAYENKPEKLTKKNGGEVILTWDGHIRGRDKAYFWNKLADIKDPTIMGRIEAEYIKSKTTTKVPKKGRGVSDEPGMMSTEIDTVMKRYKPRFLGTIARDEWKLLTPPVDSGKSGWVMNTDPKSKPGKHWVAFLMDLDNKSMEYYNSFGDDIPTDVLESLKSFLDEHNPTRDLLKLKVNKVIDQDVNSSNCGWFCCKFLIDRFRGKPWIEASGFDNHIKGEESVTKFKQQHGGSYSIYI